MIILFLHSLVLLSSGSSVSIGAGAATNGVAFRQSNQTAKAIRNVLLPPKPCDSLATALRQPSRAYQLTSRQTPMQQTLPRHQKRQLSLYVRRQCYKNLCLSRATAPIRLDSDADAMPMRCRYRCDSDTTTPPREPLHHAEQRPRAPILFLPKRHPVLEC